LRRWNRLKGNTLKAGQALVIHRPVAGESADSRPTSRRRGGKVEPVSAKAEPLDARKRHSKAAAADEAEDDTPRAAGAAKKKTASKSKKPNKLHSAETAAPVLHHKVRKGETLTSIASAYNTTVAELRRNNRRFASNLHAGDVLVIRRSEE
jgi:LysM repeat protein